MHVIVLLHAAAGRLGLQAPLVLADSHRLEDLSRQLQHQLAVCQAIAVQIASCMYITAFGAFRPISATNISCLVCVTLGSIGACRTSP